MIRMTLEAAFTLFIVVLLSSGAVVVVLTTVHLARSLWPFCPDRPEYPVVLLPHEFHKGT